ncbi:hypothetical protein LTR70_008355 [Exophiala xenobiotica]|uniref:N-acetylglucosamine-6-phosphate deacetylase n=1 Tax=Lithohypha guttulata TaxID=1690604 RepID=A0ABR0JVF0_9EURO|nr:hypothetical protein LTR24_009941 [Lithohypha guttulata]KAK5312175.1 hypothetical protein LTR70_008355 [Exophiala xenobiotica]
MGNAVNEITFRAPRVCYADMLLVNQVIKFSTGSGLITFSSLESGDSGDHITQSSEKLEEGQETLDLAEDDVLAPGLIELQTNGLYGVHFTTLTRDNHEAQLRPVAGKMAEHGVTGWFATIPTVEEGKWKEILPLLKARSFEEIGGSPLLGAHVEGPYLHPTKKGAHNDAYFKTPSLHDFRKLYGEDNLREVIKYITVAPELEGALDMIQDIRRFYPHIVTSLGHSTATYNIGVQAVQLGARSITHVFNAMNPLHHREDPGLAGLVSMPLSTSSPYFTLIPDLVHLHPAVLRMCYQASPSRCTLITDSIELAGLPDGIYPANGQITYPQRKLGNRATNVVDGSKGEKETLIGSCITLAEGIRNMVRDADVTMAEAVTCASANLADLMKDESRGRLVAGRRADFVVFDQSGYVRQTWMSGQLVWRAGRTQ